MLTESHLFDLKVNSQGSLGLETSTVWICDTVMLHNCCSRSSQVFSSSYLFSWTSWMFSMPIALLRRELKGPDFFLVGLFPGMIKDCGREQEVQWAEDSNILYRYHLHTLMATMWSQRKL